MSDSKPAPMSAEKQALLALRRMKARARGERTRPPRADCHRRTRLPLSRRSDDAREVLDAAARRRRRDRRSAGRSMEPRGVLRYRSRRRRKDVHALRRVRRRHRSIRSAVLRHGAARGGQPRSPATAGARGDAGKRWKMPGIAADCLAGSDTGVFVGICTQDYAQFQLMFGGGRARHVLRHRQRGQRCCRPPLIRARTARAEPGGRHGLLVEFDDRPPGVSEPARAGMQSGARRRCELDPASRSDGELFRAPA